MPYDRDSFLAGVAVGRNMKSWPDLRSDGKGIFALTVRINTSSEQTSIFSISTVYHSVDIDWGDDTSGHYESSSSPINHRYQSNGIYHIVMSGDLVGFRCNVSHTLISIDTPLPPISKEVPRPIYIDAGEMIADCYYLESIPSGIFSNYEGDEVYITAIDYFARQCTALKAIPSNLFRGTNFKLDPSGSVRGNTTLDGMFMQCSSLKTVPHDLFEGESFGYFTSCVNLFYVSGMVIIPEGLFDSLVNVTDCRFIFRESESLRVIPPDLFKYMESAERFNGCFEGCTSLEYAPDGIFSNLPSAISVTSVFALSGLKKTPRGCFANCGNLTMANSCFDYCHDLVEIESDVFSGCGALEDVTAAFEETGIRYIPYNLFSSNPLLVGFGSTFSGCSGIITAVPSLWLSYPDAYSRRCFRGCENASNYNDIPSEWK